ncbi:hypothetical protein STENM223S_05222 [Streptomyces tendae]
MRLPSSRWTRVSAPGSPYRHHVLVGQQENGLSGYRLGPYMALERDVRAGGGDSVPVTHSPRRTGSSGDQQVHQRAPAGSTPAPLRLSTTGLLAGSARDAGRQSELREDRFPSGLQAPGQIRLQAGARRQFRESDDLFCHVHVCPL